MGSGIGDAGTGIILGVCLRRRNAKGRQRYADHRRRAHYCRLHQFSFFVPLTAVSHFALKNY